MNKNQLIEKLIKAGHITFEEGLILAGADESKGYTPINVPAYPSPYVPYIPYSPYTPLPNDYPFGQPPFITCDTSRHSSFRNVDPVISKAANSNTFVVYDTNHCKISLTKTATA